MVGSDIRNLSRRLRDYLVHCRECQTTQTKRHLPCGDLKPIETPPEPFHTVTLDFVVGLPEYNGFNAFLSVTDKYSKRVTLLPGKDTDTAQE